MVHRLCRPYFSQSIRHSAMFWSVPQHQRTPLAETSKRWGQADLGYGDGVDGALTPTASTSMFSALLTSREVGSHTRMHARAGGLLFESPSRSGILAEHDLFRKPVSTFRDHALVIGRDLRHLLLDESLEFTPQHRVGSYPCPWGFDF